jgi:hypothetical protein
LGVAGESMLMAMEECDAIEKPGGDDGGWTGSGASSGAENGGCISDAEDGMGIIGDDGGATAGVGAEDRVTASVRGGASSCVCTRGPSRS